MKETVAVMATVAVAATVMATVMVAAATTTIKKIMQRTKKNRI
jgi:hypothetical protein